MMRGQSITRWAIARRAAMVLTLGLICGPPVAARAASEVNQSLFGGFAIDGIDPVAYFLEGRTVAGSSDFTHDWYGAEWHFASAADPERYGGYCARAVS